MEDYQDREDRIIKIDIENEMKSAYIDYSMSVIVSRALPDVRDGLKPVHRRVLYAMNEMGNIYSQPTRKSAKPVGEVLANYHPHGDSSVYFTLVRLCLLYTSDAADDGESVDLGGRRIIKKKILARRVSSCTLAFISNVVFTCSLVLWTSSFFWCSKFARNLPEGALFCGDLWSFCGIIWRSLLAKSLPKRVGLYRKRSAKWLCTNSALPKSG